MCRHFTLEKKWITINKNKEILLIERVIEGDKASFRPLIDKYKDVSLSLSISITKNFDDAEDAVQESFIRAYKYIHKFNKQSSFSTWLYRIVVNQSKTKAKKINYQNEELDLIDSKYSDDNLILSNKKELINIILNKMKYEHSLLLKLFYLAEKDTNEIKEITKFSKSKIKTGLHRARKEFQEQTEKYFGNQEINI